MRGLNPQAMQAQPQQASGGLINQQTLGMLMQAYQQYQNGQAGTSPGATGTEYAGSGMNGTGGGIGQPLVAGGQSGQSAQGYQGLLQAMMQARGMGQ